MKSYLVTGANRGIGLGLVKEILQTETNRVFATVRNLDSVADLKAIGSNRLQIVQCDISSEDSIDSCFEEISKLTGSIDVAILSAAIMEGDGIGPLQLTESKETWENFKKQSHEAYETNSLKQIYFANKVIPLIEKSQEKKLIFVSTGLASYDFTRRAKIPTNAAYSMSKAALTLVAIKYSVQLKDKGIAVLAICPGMVNSRNLTPEQIAYIFGPVIEQARRINPDFVGVLSCEDACKKFLKAVDFYGLYHSGEFISSNGSTTDF